MDYIQAEWNKKPLNTENEIPITGKIVVITCANSGIGAAAALQLAQRGARLIMPCRDMEKGQTMAEYIKRQVPHADLVSFHLFAPRNGKNQECVKCNLIRSEFRTDFTLAGPWRSKLSSSLCLSHP